MSTVIKVNNTKETNLEFDIAIQGLMEDTNPNTDVRFVVKNVNNKYNLSVKCNRNENNKWVANLPALQLESKTQPFQIEVIVDGYYFAPASGTLEVLNEPKVKIKEEASKKQIKVTASFEGSTVVEEAVPAPINLQNAIFESDAKFGKSSKMFTGVLKKSAITLDKAILKNGTLGENVNKKTVAEAVRMVRVALNFFESQLKSKIKG